MVSSPNADGIYAVSSIVASIATFVTALRLIVRRTAQREKESRSGPSWQADDWLTLVTTGLVWGLAGILIHGARVGTIGTHTATNPETGAVIVTPHENEISKLGAISQLITIVALGTVKSAVILLYRRMFRDRIIRIASLAVLAFLGIWTLAFLLATCLQCKGHNLDLMWKSISTFKSQCQDYKVVQLAHCVTDIATDLVVLLLPVREIQKLHLGLRVKFALCLIYIMGLLSVAAGTARLAIVTSNIYLTTAGARDVRGVETNVLVWTFVEVGVATIAVSLPTFGPLLFEYSNGNDEAGAESRNVHGDGHTNELALVTR